MWLQPLAMLCGLVMLMALNHVTLWRKETPFDQVKGRISPVLAWAWLGATIVADVVFCTAQNALGIATVKQNLGGGAIPDMVIAVVLSLVAYGTVVMFSRGVGAAKLFEGMLKALVAVVVLCFFGAAGYLVSTGGADLGAILKGLVPNPQGMFTPSQSLEPMIEATGPMADWWREFIAGNQRDRIITGFGTAVGINMTFLLPYTVRARGWGKKHEELSRFDLVIALFVPYAVATTLLVVVASAQFHGKTDDVLGADGKPVAAYAANYYKVLESRQNQEEGAPFAPDDIPVMADYLPEADRKLAAALTNRDAGQLSKSLEPVLGPTGANLVFGIGILAMALSTMMVHMLMNGYAVSQAVGRPGEGKPFLLGAAIPGALALFAPIVWTGDAKVALQVPAAMIATSLLPIAYLGILLLMNRTDPGEPKPPLWINLLLVLVLAIAGFGSYWSLSTGGPEGRIGMALMVALAALGIWGFLKGRQTGVGDD